MILQRFQVLQKCITLKFGQQLRRNLIPTDPIYPEREQFGVYRPMYEKRSQKVLTPKQMYLQKIDAIVNRAKGQVKEKQVQFQKQSQKSSQSQRYQYYEQLFKNVILDKETGLPIGLEFDDLVKAVKNTKLQAKESKFFDNLQLLIKKLGLCDESDFASMNKHFLSDVFKGDYLQQARIQFFQNLTSQIDNLRQQNKLDSFLEQNLNLSTHSKEFVISSIQEGRQNTITDLLKTEVADSIAKRLALEQINNNILDFKGTQYECLQNKDAKTQLASFKESRDPNQLYNQDPLFDANFTFSDQSDHERVVGQRLVRKERGDRGLLDYDKMKDGENLNLIKRNYFRNKNEYVQERALEERKTIEQDIVEENQQEIDEEDEEQKHFWPMEMPTVNNKLFSLLEVNDMDVQLHKEAQSINEQLNNIPTFNEIYDRIDFFLNEAPQYLKQLSLNKKECLEKPYNPQILQLDLQKRDLVWDQFSDNFSTLFPLSWQKKGQDLNNNQVERQQYNQESFNEEETFALELYKEFKQTKNEQFFKHYIANDLKFKSEALEHSVRQSQEGIQPTIFQEDYSKYVDQDIAEFQQTLQNIEDEPAHQTIEEAQPEDIYSQFNEAKEKYYIGRGKRKSCKCVAKVTKGHGEFMVNGKIVLDYMPQPYYRHLAMVAIELSGLSCYVNVDVRICGSGISAQADAISLATTRALIQMCPGLKKRFRDVNMTKTDRRVVERKKAGLLKARKKWPYSRR